MPKLTFLDEVSLKVTGSQTYELTEPFRVVIHTLSPAVIVTIDPGFDFDGASIPRALWGVVGSPLTGLYVKAALLHDGLYASELFGRYVCDSIFLDGMEVCGVNPVLRNAMYVGVRFGGRSVWAAHERSDVAYYKQIVRFENYMIKG